MCSFHFSVDWCVRSFYCHKRSFYNGYKTYFVIYTCYKNRTIFWRPVDLWWMTELLINLLSSYFTRGSMLEILLTKIRANYCIQQSKNLGRLREFIFWEIKHSWSLPVIGCCQVVWVRLPSRYTYWWVVGTNQGLLSLILKVP